MKFFNYKHMKLNNLFKVTIALLLISCGASQTTTQTTNTPKVSQDPRIESVKTEKVKAPSSYAKMIAKKGEITEEELNSWPHADLNTDSIPGMSLDKAYAFLKGKKGNIVIVGVIDSGIDIEHEDLKDVLWTNQKEIAGNGKDDDKNGYIDDIHGWNFLGGEIGQSIPEQLEITRLVKKWTPKFAGKSLNDISTADKVDYEEYIKLKKIIDDKFKNAKKMIAEYAPIQALLVPAYAAIKKELGDKPLDLDNLNSLKLDSQSLEQGKYIFMNVINQGATPDEAMSEIEEIVNHYKNQADAQFNIDFNGRVSGDDPYNIEDKTYGNGNVIGNKTSESHGTHVSGIILANRDNNIGTKGVAHNTQLMAIRAVPDGDEYDKDVALAIRYAVDNGARVVNMSFGKSHSPNAQWIYDAIQYAAEKDVLLVHASGNESHDLDIEDSYPTDAPDKITEVADNVITVGSITRHYTHKLVSDFSNYGKKNVDIFAPGSEIYAPVPNNKYMMNQGTSMAAPEVAGVAALIRSYYPKLSASQVKHILMKSGTGFPSVVIKPGSETDRLNFKDLSISGKFVNAYNALKLASEMSKDFD